MSTSAQTFPTGINGLDIVLGGGLSRGSMVFLVGTSGAGKTVLGSQILCNAARRGEQVLILTAFSESHVKLIEHLSPFSFFSPEAIGTTITLLSMQSLLGEATDAAASGIIRAIRESGAHLVLIDGFQGVAALLHDNDTVRQMVASLAGQLPYLDVTLLVTLEGSARDTGVALELATADVVIGLEYRTDGWRHLRRLEIVKQRGRAPLPGLHAYAITSAGIALSPRLEALLLNSEPGHGTIREHTTRASFGLPELDSLLDGGLGARTITLLAAAPGVGKTLLALHWALAPVSCDVAQPGKTLYLTFHEHIGELRQKASAFGLPLERALEEDAMQIIRLLPIELNPDYAVTKIIEAATSGSAHRLVIDDLGSLLAELGPRARDFLSALKELLYRSGMTSLLLLEIPPLQGLRLDLESVPLSLMADNVIIVQQYHAAGTLHRILTVLKMRFSSHDRTFRELVVANNRIRVLSPAETAPGVLDQIEASLDAGALSATQKRSG